MQSKRSCYTKDCVFLEVTANFRAARPLSEVGEDKITLNKSCLLYSVKFCVFVQ